LFFVNTQNKKAKLSLFLLLALLRPPDTLTRSCGLAKRCRRALTLRIKLQN